MISSLTSSIASASAAPSAQAAQALGAAARTPSARAAEGAERVSISSQGRLLGSLPELLTPSRANVARLTSDARAELDAAMQAKGIAAEPGFSMSIDSATGKLMVSGSAGNAAEVQALLDDNPALATKLHTALAIASHAVAMEPAMRFDAEYRAAQSRSEVNQVVEKYSWLLNGQQATDIALRVDGQGASLLANGAAWMSVS